MKRSHTPARPRIAAALIAAAVLPLTPSFAQDSVPAVQPTVPVPAAAASAPAPAPAPAFQPRQEVVQPVPPRPAPVEAIASPAAAPPNRNAARPAARRAIVRAAPAVAAVTPPAAAAPAVTPSAPVPAPLAVPPVEAASAESVPAPVDNPVAVSEAPRGTTPWLALGAVIALAALVLGVLFRRRRSRNEAGIDEGYVAAEEPAASADDVDLAERPWIRMMLQPTRTESYNGEQTVDYQLIVENEGRIPAHDVRVSSFLEENGEFDSVRGEQSHTHHIDIEPGASVPLPGTVTVRDGVDPKIIADARYKLPDGGEGHLAALFGIDTSATEPSALVEDVLERV